MPTSGQPPTSGAVSGDDPVAGPSACVTSNSVTSMTHRDQLPAEVADLPILEEVPLLGSAIALVRGIDRLVAQLLEVLIELEDHEVAETATGVMLEQWLAIAGRRTGSDRRMLLTACGVLRRLPSLRTAFCDDGTVSWAQVRAIVLAVHRLPRVLDDVVDGELARTIEGCRDADPDMLTSAVSRAAHSWDPAPTRKAQEAADRGEFIAMQPRLDGSGGQLFGELGALSFATVDAALSAPEPAHPAPTETSDSADRHRSRGEDDPAALSRSAEDERSRGKGAPPGARRGQHRARRLVQLCDAGLEGARTDRAPIGGAAHTTGSTAGVSRPQLLVRIELASLLDRSSMPAELLTHLTGGKLWLDASTARRLVDARGADLRSIVLDECGRVVGVGRRARIAPGWLGDATLALHDTCTQPSCRVSARRCQSDHADPWHPVRPEDVPGRTDIDQVAPLCGHHNRSKEVSGWRVSQAADGTRRWTHPRSGLTTVTRPATWRPVGRVSEGFHRHDVGSGSGQVDATGDRPPAAPCDGVGDGHTRFARDPRADYVTTRQRPPPQPRSRHPVIGLRRRWTGSRWPVGSTRGPRLESQRRARPGR